MLAAKSDSSAAHQANLTKQVLEHFDVGTLPFEAIADSDFPLPVTDDRYPAWHPDTYPFEAIVKGLFAAQL